MLPVDAAAVMTCTQVNDTVPSQLETADLSTGRISEMPQAIRPEPPNRPNGDRTNRVADTVCITVARAACRVDATNVLSANVLLLLVQPGVLTHQWCSDQPTGCLTYQIAQTNQPGPLATWVRWSGLHYF